MIPIKTSAKVKYPIGGFAPGNYWNHCATCKERFSGDKRAVQCEPCAINSINEAAVIHGAEVLRLRGTLSDIVAYIEDGGLESSNSAFPAIKNTINNSLHSITTKK